MELSDERKTRIMRILLGRPDAPLNNSPENSPVGNFSLEADINELANNIPDVCSLLGLWAAHSREKIIGWEASSWYTGSDLLELERLMCVFELGQDNLVKLMLAKLNGSECDDDDDDDDDEDDNETEHGIAEVAEVVKKLASIVLGNDERKRVGAEVFGAAVASGPAVEVASPGICKICANCVTCAGCKRARDLIRSEMRSLIESLKVILNNADTILMVMEKNGFAGK